MLGPRIELGAKAYVIWQASRLPLPHPSPEVALGNSKVSIPLASDGKLSVVLIILVLSVDSLNL
jgi:hypothetical protein